MRSNYKRLGDYIEPCDEKNDGNLVKELRGISNQKYFQKAKTNTIGIDLSKYRVVRTGQFAFNRATTRNGDKISIALRQGTDCIVSPSYRIFKSKNENILNSEYLMMWFRRPEFDRYARFKSHGSAHEFFDYDEMCEVELPIPSIEKQRALVKEYNTVVNRIKLNEQLNQKLEETAQALYKHWFVDFEFPNEKGEPYKSNGGAMVYNEELDKEIPEGWSVDCLDSLMELYDNLRVPLSGSERLAKKGVYPYYGAASLMDYVNDFLFDGEYTLMGEDGSVINDDRSPVLQFVWGRFWVNNHAHVIKAKYPLTDFALYIFLKNTDVSGIITGGVQGKINQGNLNQLKILVPHELLIKKFIIHIELLKKRFKLNSTENIELTKLKDLILSKMTKVEQEKVIVN